MQGEHPFARQNAVRLRDLDGQNYLNRASCEFNGYADRYFEEQAVECTTVYQSDRDDWILAMIRSGLGFGFMPANCITGTDVIARPLVEPEMWRDVNLVTVRGRPHSPAVGALVREAMRIKWQGAPALAVARREAEAMNDAKCHEAAKL
jgi:LysR family hydrogen peroxide-inducible transcriptional activator